MLSTQAGCPGPQAESGPPPEIIAALVPVCRALPMALGMARTDQPAQTGQLAAAALDPHLMPLSGLRSRYKALSHVDKLRIHAEVQRQCRSELQSFYTLLSRHTNSLDVATGPAVTRAYLRPIVERLQAAQGMWALEFFSEEAIEEIEEMTQEGAP